MKLLNKILPFAGIAAATCVMTPFVTSCTQSSGLDFEWKLSDGAYVSDINPLDTDGMTVLDADDKYFGDIQNNYKIFANDFAYQWLETYTNADTQTIIIQSLNIDVLDISDAETTYDEYADAAEHEVYNISYDVSFTGLGYVESYLTYPRWTPISCHISFKNIPYCGYVVYGTTSGTWYLGTPAWRWNTGDVWTFNEDFQDWSIEISWSDKSTTSEEIYSYKNCYDYSYLDPYLMFTAFRLADFANGIDGSYGYDYDVNEPFYMHNIYINR